MLYEVLGTGGAAWLRASALILFSTFSAAAATVTLAWDASTDQTVTGYNLYYGGDTRSYTNVVDATSATSMSVSNLFPGATYFFAATAYNSAGLESDYSVEVSYTVPAGTNANMPPTLDQPGPVVINESSGPHTVTLTGISSGSPTETQPLDVTGFSSNPALVPQPTVEYTSPNSSGNLTFAPVAGAYGSCSITVRVFDGGAVNNTTIRSFTVTVLPVNNPPTLDPLTDVVIDENTGTQTVGLTGITCGAGESEAVVVTALSSDPALIPSPAVSYSSPNTTGLLTFSPAPNQSGSARITVTLNDNQPTNNLFSRSFVVTVRPSGPGDTNITASTSWTLWWQRSDGVTALWQMDGTNMTKSLRLNAAPAASGWKMVGQADFDRDGNADLLWQHTDGWVGLWLMNNTNCVRTMRVGNGPAGQGWCIAATGDLDGDGSADILWQHSSSGATAVWFMDHTNCTRQARLNAPLASAGWRLAGARDFDGDGHLDLLWQHVSGVVAVWLMEETNCISNFRLSTPPADSGWSIVGTADLRGAGRGDILWQHDNGTLAFWLMNGTNRVGTGRLYPSKVEPVWRIMGPK